MIFFSKAPSRDKKNFKVFLKKSNFKILDLGELGHFQSIAPHLFFQKKISLGAFLGALRGPLEVKKNWLTQRKPRKKSNLRQTKPRASRSVVIYACRDPRHFRGRVFFKRRCDSSLIIFKLQLVPYHNKTAFFAEYAHQFKISK